MRPKLTGYAAALAAVAVVSLAIGFVLESVSLATGSMLYLLAVLATAVAFGRGPAIFASVAAFLIFDWFFVEPLHQFNVSNPEEWLSLLVFLLTATVTGQLAAGQRQRTKEAEQREREAVILYDVVRLMAEADLDHAQTAVAERLRNELPEVAEASSRIASAVATQISLAVERDRLSKAATEAEILRRTDQLRGALLNAVSHDLRTPLATIMASAGSLQQRDVHWTDAEADGFAQAIEEEAAHLNHLVGNLLDLSRIEAGNLRPDKSWHDLGALIDDVLDRLRPVTADHQISRHIPQDLPPVWLDSVEMGEAVYNLIENAAKYAPPQTEIEIAVQRGPGAFQVSVADRGPGISPAALPYLFDPFYRVIDSGPHPAGLGLGLAVVKGLITAHGGQVSAENRVGGGARFLLTLPQDESETEPSPTSAVSAA